MTRAQRVLYVQYTNPAGYPPLEHSMLLLIQAGCEVFVLGTLAQDDRRRLPDHPHLTSRFLPFVGGGWRQKAHYVAFAFWVMWWCVRWRVTWVYASEPLACPVGLAASAVLRRRLIYHEHDSPDVAAVSRFMRMALWTRGVLARRAEVCVLPNSDRAAAFALATGAPRVQTVWNCPGSGEVPARPSVRQGDGLRVFYHGSIVPARLPPAVIMALARLPGHVRLAVAGYETAGHPGYVAELRQVADSLGVGDRVQWLGPIPYRDDLLRACATHDVGLSLMPTTSEDVNERTMFGASNKVFDYMACGLAVLVSDLPGWRRLADEGFGRLCDPASSESIAEALAWFSDRREDTARMGQSGRHRILNEWNYERGFGPVLTRIVRQAEADGSRVMGRTEA